MGKLGRRCAVALFILLLSAILVYVQRDGYKDSAGGPLSFLDALYYSTVSLTTTGYGDIVPVTASARLLTIIIITPLRLIFLGILLTTTIFALTEQFRQGQRATSWRRRMKGHTIVCGFGVAGRAAVRTLKRAGGTDHLVIIDSNGAAVDRALSLGLTATRGDATMQRILESLNGESAAQFVISVGKDDTSALVCLTARRINPTARIVVNAIEEENAPLLRQCGADVVVCGPASSGALLAMSAMSPAAGAVAEDLLDFSAGLDLVEREVTADECGHNPKEIALLVLGVVRDGRMIRFDDPGVGTLRPGDHVIYVHANEEPTRVS